MNFQKPEPPLSECAFFLREDAIDIAQAMIAAAPTWTLPHVEKAYFHGMTVAWVQAGVLTAGELEYLRDQLTNALAAASNPAFSSPRHWWQRIRQALRQAAVPEPRRRSTDSPAGCSAHEASRQPVEWQSRDRASGF